MYVGGQFTSVRPPGDPLGTGEVARTYLAAFNSTTGALITSFNPAITNTAGAANPGVYALAVSPDGKTLYAGGTFDHVNGAYHDNLAAFSTATGAPTSWAPSATAKVDTVAVSPSGSQIYFGGNFSHVDGVARTYAGAVDASGNLLPWAPVLNSTVYSLAVAPDDSQVVLGGYFQTINGVTQNAAGAVDPTTGTTNVPWGANIVPWHPGTCTSTVKNVVISGGTAYLAAEGNGGGCFDGDFAVSLGSTDSLLWQNDCLGATQALEVVNGYLFKGSHAHDCAYTPGGFPQVPRAAAGSPGTCLTSRSPTARSGTGRPPPTRAQPIRGRQPRPACDGHRRQPAVRRRRLHHRQRRAAAGLHDLPGRAGSAVPVEAGHGADRHQHLGRPPTRQLPGA